MIWKSEKQDKIRNEKDVPKGYTITEWESLKVQFDRDLKNAQCYVESFRELINKILGNDTYLDFVSKTDLSESMFYRIKNRAEKNDPPQRSTLISICIGYELDLAITQYLLHSLGLDFNLQNRRDYAYIFLLTQCRGKEIEECNEILKALGIEEKYLLGQYARSRRNN